MIPRLREITAYAALLAILALTGMTAGASETRPLLSFVPADTVAYFGNTEPFPEVAVWREWQRQAALADEYGINGLNPTELTEELGEAAGVSVAFLQIALESLASDAEQPLPTLGLAAGNVFAAYAVGARPVLRQRLASAERFWAVVDAAETRAGVEPRESGRDDFRMRRYAFAGDATEGDSLLVATHGGYAVITPAIGEFGDDNLDIALGLEPVTDNLAANGRVEALNERYGLEGSSSGYVDHELLVRGLSGDTETRLGRMIERMPADEVPWSELGDDCRDDALALAALWPHTVFGVTAFDTDSGRLASRVRVAGTDDGLLGTIMRLRGELPAALDLESIGAAAIGLNVAELVPVAQALVGRLAEAEWHCPALVRAQMQADPAAVGQLAFFTAMIGDVRGAALAVRNLRFSGGSNPEADAIVEIATPRPETLWQLAMPFLPGGPPAEAPTVGGPAVTLAAMPGIENPLRVALREGSLLVLSGAVSAEDVDGATAGEGLLAFRYDTREAGRAIAAYLDQAGDEIGEDERAAMAALASESDAMSAIYRGGVDVDLQGFRLDIEMAPAD